MSGGRLIRRWCICMELTTTHTVSSPAIAVAMRGLPSRMAISPNSVPCGSAATMTGAVGPFLTIRTLPLSIK